ncbi:metal-dependent RNase [Ceratobasidium theobromae]|uniref:Metal-dependent RNase n=1 Tax=Ceratobasidium theobromae TaxID=1582974 RepID=A0A5N5Q881_9AGAM|nr:metal-dependent RNase [Ceratobasidium theobromae]
MMAATRSPSSASLALRSSTSMEPSSAVATTLTARPAPAAEAALVVRDGEQARELALGARGRLQGDSVVAGELREALGELGEDDPPADRLLRGGVGVDPGERRLEPDGGLGCRVELEGARAQRDHRAVQGEVAVPEAPDVAHERGLRAVGVEGRMGEELGPAGELRRNREVAGLLVGRQPLQLTGAHVRERLDDGADVLVRRRLVRGQADVVGVEEAQVDAALGGPGDGGLGAARDGNAEGVEEEPVLEVESGVLHADGDPRGLAVHVLGDAGESLGTVVNGVEGGDDGEERLRGADVGGGLLAADVLLAGLEGEAVGLVALGVVGDADDSPGDLPLELFRHRHEAGVGAAEEQGDAEALGGADGDVGADGARFGEEREGERVGVDGDEPAGLVDGVDGGGEVLDRAAGGGVGEDGAQDRGGALGQGGAGGDGVDARAHRRQAEALATGLRDLEALGMEALVEDDGAALGLAHAAVDEQDGLGDGGGLVEQGRAGDRQAGEVGDDGLEEELGLEAPLADLGLVGRIGGGPGGVGQDVADDDGRGDGRVVAAADHLGVGVVEGGEAAQRLDGIRLGEPAGGGAALPGRLVLGGLHTGQSGRDDGVGELVEGVDAEGAEDRRG